MKYYSYLDLDKGSKTALRKAFIKLVPNWRDYKKISANHMTIGYCEDERCPQDGQRWKVKTKRLGIDGKNVAVLVDDGGISNLRNPHITLGVASGGHGIDSNRLKFDKDFPSMTLSGIVKTVPQTKPKYEKKREEVIAMNLAEEITRVARDLQAAGDIDILESLIPAYKKNANRVSNAINSIKYIDGQTRDKETRRRDRYIRLMNWVAFSRSDFEYEIFLYLEQSGLDSWITLEVEGPYGKNSPIDAKEFKGHIPVATIVRAIEDAMQ